MTENPTEDAFHSWLGVLGTPEEDAEGHRYTLAERVLVHQHRVRALEELDAALRHRDPAAVLLETQRRLLQKEYPNQDLLKFARDICKVFGFTEPPTFDSLWCITAISVLKSRILLGSPS